MPSAQWPASAVEMRPIERLTPYIRNARVHSDEQIAKIAASVREFGWTVPVLVDGDGTIIAGHARLAAAKKLGIAEVPVMVARDWTKAQMRAYVIADNRLALDASWDDELLKIELTDLQAFDFDLGLTGFGEEELQALLADRTEGLTDPDDVPEVEEIAVSQPGDCWLLGKHRLVCGDATNPENVAKALGGITPHLMVTDPPYGVSYDPDWRNRADRANGKPYGDRAVGQVSNDDKADWREAWALFPGDVAYVWHDARRAHTVAESLRAAGFEIRSQIIWAKRRPVISRGDYHWQHEPLFYSVRKGRTGHWSGDRKQTTLWQIEHRKSETGHGTQKPVECMRRPIENNSSPGQAVYEPFCGSGTTIIACEMTGRQCLALELDPTYVDVACKRFMAFAGQHACLEDTGKTFAETAVERGVRPPHADEEAPGA